METRDQVNSVIDANALALAAEYARNVEAYHASVRRLNDEHQRALAEALELFSAAQRDLVADLTTLVKQRA